MDSNLNVKPFRICSLQFLLSGNQHWEGELDNL